MATPWHGLVPSAGKGLHQTAVGLLFKRERVLIFAKLWPIARTLHRPSILG